MYEKIFGDYPQVKVINYLLTNPDKSYTKKEIAFGASISRVTLNSFFDTLKDLEIITKKGSAYKLNIDSDIVKILIKTQITLADIVMKQDIEKAELIKGEVLSNKELSDFFESFDYEININDEIEKIENKELLHSDITLEHEETKNITTSNNLNKNFSINGFVNKETNKRMINYG